MGGMAAVYSGDHRNGKRVAIKMLHAELSVDAEIRTRFLREGLRRQQGRAPRRGAVLDDEIDDDGTVFLVMELLDGETLGAARCERKARTLAIEEMLLIADQLLDVLAAAHEKDIVHRDIKPDNIFLTRDGGGEAPRLRHRAAARALRPQTSATRSGATMGTPAYMAAGAGARHAGTRSMRAPTSGRWAPRCSSC